MNAPAIYETFESFEERAAEIYVLLSRHFTSNTRLSWFWAEIALEELQHSSALRLCREYELFNIDGVNEESIGTIEGLLERAKEIGLRPDVTVREAFQLALEIESSELDRVFEKLTRGLYGSYPFLLDSFHRGYGDHLRRFGRAVSDFCGDSTMAEKFGQLAGRHSL